MPIRGRGWPPRHAGIHSPDFDACARTFTPLLVNRGLKLFWARRDPLRSPHQDGAAAAAGSNSRSRSGHPTRAGRGRIAPRGTSQARAQSWAPTKSPPSSGGALILSLRAASASGVRMVGLVPLWMDTLVAECLGAALVVAFEQCPNPAQRERQDLRDLFNLISARQHPPPAAGDAPLPSATRRNHPPVDA